MQSWCHHEARCRVPTRSCYQARSRLVFRQPRQGGRKQSSSLLERAHEQLASLLGSSPSPIIRSILGSGWCRATHTLASTSRRSPPKTQRGPQAGPDLCGWAGWGSPTARNMVSCIMAPDQETAQGPSKDGLVSQAAGPRGSHWPVKDNGLSLHPRSSRHTEK
jgi:hypothetical protein